MSEHSLIRRSFTVTVEPEAFIKRRLVSGPIWLEGDGKHFPSKDWTDFPVAVLGFWLTNLTPLILNQQTLCECPFMDGPYEFDVRANSAQGWILSFVEHDADAKIIVHEFKVRPEVLIASVLSSAQAVARFCRQAEWVDKDLLELETRITETKEMLADERN
ncbi:MAG: hypothetical protein ACT4OT_11735 [Acidobacteriota bacterium]